MTEWQNQATDELWFLHRHLTAKHRFHTSFNDQRWLMQSQCCLKTETHSRFRPDLHIPRKTLKTDNQQQQSQITVLRKSFCLPNTPKTRKQNLITLPTSNDNYWQKPTRVNSNDNTTISANEPEAWERLATKVAKAMGAKKLRLTQKNSTTPSKVTPINSTIWLPILLN